LHSLLGGSAWCGGEGHANLDCERFADLVAWAYWPSGDNVMKPQSTTDEGGQVAPAVFRSALAAILPGLPVTLQSVTLQPQSTSVRTTAAAKPVPAKRRRKA
jgi:hypothetical protein